MRIESKAWLKIAKKCVRIRNKAVFLCEETEAVEPPALSSQMCCRLTLFRPAKWGGPQSLWWYSELPGITRKDANDQRALACCFLAVMAEGGDRA